MNRYELYHGSHRITTLTGRSMSHVWQEAVQTFERWCWQERQAGRGTSRFAFRLVPARNAPVRMHPGWEGTADD